MFELYHRAMDSGPGAIPPAEFLLTGLRAMLDACAAEAAATLKRNFRTLNHDHDDDDSLSSLTTSSEDEPPLDDEEDDGSPWNNNH
jgi:hypothetical protein